MRARMVGWITVLLMVFVAPPLFAELTPEQTQAAEALIAKLGDADAKVREQAMQDLAKTGPEVVPLLRNAAQRTEDPVVQKSCQSTEEVIDREQPFIVEDGKVEWIDWRPTRVSLDVTDAKVEDVLKLIAERTGDPPLSFSNPDKLKVKPVTLKLDDAKYWEAVDALCRAGTLHVYYYPGQPLSIMPAYGKHERTVMAIGPALLDASISPYASAPGTPETLRMTLGIGGFVEPRIVIVRNQMDIEEVKSADGQDLVDSEQRRLNATYREPARRDGHHSIALKPEKKPVGPTTIKGAMRLTAALGLRELKAGPLRIGGDPVEAKLEADGVTLTVAGVNKEKGDVQVLLTVKAADGKRLPYLLNDTNLAYGFRLEDADGKRWAKLRNYDVKSRAGGYSGIAGPTRTISDFVVAMSEKNAFATLMLTFADVPGEGPWTLVFAYPTRCVPKEFPFTIGNVPLP